MLKSMPERNPMRTTVALDDDLIEKWIRRAHDHAASLPPKKPKEPKAKKPKNG